MADSHDDIDHHVKIYMRVFAALIVLTFVTVGVTYIHLPLAGAVMLALFIASIKGGLVACYFMHLISEQKMIFWILGLTFFFFIGLLSLPSLWAADVIAI